LPAGELSDMSLSKVLRTNGISGATVHGFRSSFRDWAGDCTTFPRETIEEALSHQIGDKAERAYRRSTALEKRRALMASWADYCTGAAARWFKLAAPARPRELVPPRLWFRPSQVAETIRISAKCVRCLHSVELDLSTLPDGTLVKIEPLLRCTWRGYTDDREPCGNRARIEVYAPEVQLGEFVETLPVWKGGEVWQRST
jgi:hypothetical protein